jgi:hypothetical protein
MKPPSISLDALRDLLKRELIDYSCSARELFGTVAFDPVRWTQSR